MQKNCFKRLVNKNGAIFCDTLKYNQECITCITNNKAAKGYSSIKCPKDNIKSLIGNRHVNSGFVFACGQGYGKNSLFVQDLDALTSSLSTLSKAEYEVEKYINDEFVTRIRRVLHNIRSINAHSLQEVRALVPEYYLKHHKNKSLVKFEEFIIQNTKRTANSFFRISKDLYEIKAEFSVYDKLVKGEVELNKRPYNIRDVVMTVLYPFFEDFSNKNVVVTVEDYYDSIPIDFESIQVALYHIIENMSKYIQCDTNAIISFRKNNNHQLIEFQMHSLYMEQDEIDMIFIEGYSGKNAKKAHLNGEGIGMFRAKTLVELNGGSLSVKAGPVDTTHNNIEYALNQFIINLPQQ